MGKLENRKKGLEESVCRPKKENRIEGSRKMQSKVRLRVISAQTGKQSFRIWSKREL